MLGFNRSSRAASMEASGAVFSIEAARAALQTNANVDNIVVTKSTKPYWTWFARQPIRMQNLLVRHEGATAGTILQWLL